MQRLFRPGGLLVLALLFLLVLACGPAAAQTEPRCFEETGYCIEGRIRDYWEQNGGLPVFGFPISEERPETIEGETFQVQWFERNRLELHPENAPPYDVLLGRLGVDALEAQGRDWRSFAKGGDQLGCRYFPETDQSICGEILAAWRANGLELGDPGISEAESLALFGLPVSPAQLEQLSDGNEYTVQWFERARFELHPENDPPYNVLLGLLGNDLVNNAPDNGGGEPQPGETPEPPPPASTVWPSLQLVSPITGLTRPTHVTHAGDGSGRLFVVEQEGTIRVVRDGVLQETPFLDIRDRTSSGGERGLLSVAFPPDYASKGYFYIDYTDTNGDSVIARYFVTDNPDVADAGSEQVILFIEQPYANHNGGQLAFGPQDGYLYIGKGDGGSGGDPENRAQDLSTLLGKILRIDVESGADPYAIPPDNPFVQNPDARDEIWSYGLRNPWRFSFDTATYDLYIADVGQDRVEEVNFQPAASNGGENYGWRIMEGNECFQAETCDTSGLTMPVVTYPRTPPNCSVTGGMVYRGDEYPDMQGIYYYADYCSSQVWGLRRDSSGTWQNQPLIEAEFPITSFGTDEAGNLYMTDYFNGTIYRVAD